MKKVWLFTAIFAFLMLSSTAIFLSSPNFIVNLSEEDKPLENLNAAVFLVASLVGISLYKKNPPHRNALLFWSFVSLTGFLDELSFGARIFHIKMPMVMGTTFDAAHDLFYIGLKAIYVATVNHPVFMVPFLFLGTLLVLFILFRYRAGLMAVGKRLYRNKPSFLLASFFLVLLFLALLIDLDQIDNEFLYLLEELFELSASIALFFLILSLQTRRAVVTGTGHAMPSGQINNGITAHCIIRQVRFIKKVLRPGPKGMLSR